ncbi:GntR family transcriptional regulator/MocR family aminotransferase [Leucobacter exalbidus]|uniref:GntR family transcriptional regulator/MocR family aminotransferase n=1 Tax=Leucobacter exalbidus TaxID=662960 RepID=A0A940PRA6_9MICO|nr:PLP-dependent aminotransferase family protein [Leucobacter exalbidus]MBP1324785.1 GntR family transcriptional regulator/MocR family aminotransferase [Leucobacter exalbidus]
MGIAGELPITLDRSGSATLPAQVAAGLRDAIDRDMLRPGESLPSTRDLAARLDVARGVIVAAYEQLVAEGYLLSGHGRGTVVHPRLDRARAGQHGEPVDATEATALPAALPAHGPLAPGTPLADAVDRPAWRSAWRHAATLAHLAAPELGDPRLREEIAEHLRQMRGTRRSPADVIVTAGARDGLSLLLTALGTTRGRALVVGVEDPGYPSLRQVAARHGARIVALPVDADGLVTTSLPTGVLDVVIVTPSHQYPLGGSLPLTRRRELLDWATRTGVVIVEDDYDSELRHVGSPLPTLTALDDPETGTVVLLGTFSKTLSPALAAGFLLAPRGLRRLIEPVRSDLGGPVSAVVQAALARYLSEGELRRHIARMRRRYARRRDLLSERLAGQPGWRVRPTSGGLHAVIELTPGSTAREQRVLELADAAGLGAVGLSSYWEASNVAGSTGLVIGMGGPDDDGFDRALTVLRRVLAA